MDQDTQNAVSINTYIGRQPIFDSSMKNRAYELLYRSSADATNADFSDDHIATLHVIANTLFNTDLSTSRGRLFVNYSRQAILDMAPLTLPPGSVVKVKQSQVKGKNTLEILKKIRKADYMIAVDDCSSDAPQQLFRIADVIIVDFLTPAEELQPTIEAAQSHGCTVMAKRIESHEQFESAKALGIDLYQGFFFHKPEVIAGKRFNTSECSRLNLLEFVREDAPDFDKLSDMIQMDPALTHRLLFYINSPYFSVMTKITTVKRAISLLGWNKVKNLLLMVILTDAKSPLSNELFITSATRAMFLKMVAEEHPDVECPPDELYIVGLLSLLDTIFQIPMDEVVRNIALDETLKSMLIEKKGDLYAWLELAMAFEAGAWDRVDSTIEALGLNFVKVAKGYYEALKWVNLFYGTLI